MKDKRIVLLAGGAILLALIALALLVNLVSGTAEVRNFAVTNVTDTSATFVWTTDKPAKATAVVSMDDNFSGKDKFYDLRDMEEVEQGVYEVSGEEDRYTHFITVKDLSPETTYNFEIMHNGKTAEVGLEEFNTTEILDAMGSPDPVYGQVFDSAGERVEDGIVFFSVNGEETASEYRTAYVTDGTYTLDVHGLKDENLEDLYKITETDTETLEYYVEDNGQVSEAVYSFSPEEDQPVADMTVDGSVNAYGESKFMSDVNAKDDEDADNPGSDESLNEPEGDIDYEKLRNEQMEARDNIGNNSGTEDGDSSINQNIGEEDGGIIAPKENDPIIFDKNELDETTPDNSIQETDSTKDSNDEDNSGQDIEGVPNVKSTKNEGKTESTPADPSLKSKGEIIEDARIGGTINRSAIARESILDSKNSNTARRTPSEGNRDLSNQIPGWEEELNAGNGVVILNNNECGDNPKYKYGFNVRSDSTVDISTCKSKSASTSGVGYNATTNYCCETDITAADNSLCSDEGSHSVLTKISEGATTVGCTQISEEQYCCNPTLRGIPPMLSVSIPSCGIGFTHRPGGLSDDCIEAPNRSCIKVKMGEGDDEIVQYVNCITTESITGKITTSNCPEGTIHSGNVATTNGCPTSCKAPTCSCEGLPVEQGENFIPASEEGDPIINFGNGLHICKVVNSTDDVGMDIPISTGLTKSPQTFIQKLIKNTKAQDTTTRVVDPGIYEVSYEGRTRTIEVLNKGKVRFYYDENDNGKLDNSEEYLTEEESMGISYEVNVISEVANYKVSEGWNALSFPMIMSGENTSNVVNASDLIREFNSQGANVTHVTTFRDGQPLIFSSRLDNDGEEVIFGPDYKIFPGEGYFLKNYEQANTRLTGNKVQGALDVAVKNGWNLIGIYNEAKPNYGAFEVMRQMNAQSLSVDVMSEWESGQYTNVVINEGVEFGNDYTVYPNGAYWIRSEVAAPGGKYTPE